MNGFKSEKQNLEIDAKADQEPIKLKNRSNMISGLGSGDNVGSGMEVSGLGNIIDMSMKGWSEIENDTQTLNLGGGGNRGIVFIMDSP